MKRSTIAFFLMAIIMIAFAPSIEAKSCFNRGVSFSPDNLPVTVIIPAQVEIKFTMLQEVETLILNSIPLAMITEVYYAIGSGNIFPEPDMQCRSAYLIIPSYFFTDPVADLTFYKAFS